MKLVFVAQQNLHLRFHWDNLLLQILVMRLFWGIELLELCDLIHLHFTSCLELLLCELKTLVGLVLSGNLFFELSIVRFHALDDYAISIHLLNEDP